MQYQLPGAKESLSLGVGTSETIVELSKNGQHQIIYYVIVKYGNNTTL